eukprot:10223506-Alexandrium_andersonii.AAC.1
MSDVPPPMLQLQGRSHDSAGGLAPHSATAPLALADVVPALSRSQQNRSHDIAGGLVPVSAMAPSAPADVVPAGN